jgi:hypothetical protein
VVVTRTVGRTDLKSTGSAIPGSWRRQTRFSPCPHNVRRYKDNRVARYVPARRVDSPRLRERGRLREVGHSIREFSGCPAGTRCGASLLSGREDRNGLEFFTLANLPVRDRGEGAGLITSCRVDQQYVCERYCRWPR